MKTLLQTFFFFLMVTFVVNAQLNQQNIGTKYNLRSMDAKKENVNGFDANILTKAKSDSTPCFYKRKAEWQKIIDDYWGPGLPTATKLQIFDYFWNLINTTFAGFPYLNVNWDSLKTLYRPVVAAGVSRGRFQAILGQMYFPLCEAHTFIADAGLDSSFFQGDSYVFRPGVPMLWINGWGPIGNFGAALSPLPDSTLLVYRAIPSHPLGLVPGDIVLGYDGITWKQLYKELFSAQLPFEWWDGPAGSTERSTTYAMLNSAGNNWSLFDTIDIVKYASGDTVHLPTAPLVSLDWFSLYSTDQLPVTGVPMPDLANEKYVSYGVIENTQIGYIYVCRWNAEDSAPFAAAMADLITVKKVTGIILDYRYNLGSSNSRTAANAGYNYLFSQNPGGASRWRNAMRTGGHNDFSYSDPYDVGIVMQPNSYDKPVAVLVGPHARSFGDLNAFLIRSYPKVRFFGLPTNGSFPVPGSCPFVEGQWGTWYYDHAGGQMQSLYKNEGLLMHKGFPVDEEVWLTRDGVAKGEDDVVKAAINWINNYTSVQDHNDGNVVKNYALAQNYPNPFNPSTKISWQLPIGGQATLKVYDILGKEVATLANEYRRAGKYETEFSAKGGSASGGNAIDLPSGVYFYQLKAGEYISVKKMILLK